MDESMGFLMTLPRKNKGKRDRGYYYNQRQRIIKKRMRIARRNGINVYRGKLAKSSVAS
jgi:hypothetical protein